MRDAVTPGPSENKLDAKFMVVLHIPDTKTSTVSVVSNNVLLKGDTHFACKLDVKGMGKKMLQMSFRGKGRP